MKRAKITGQDGPYRAERPFSKDTRSTDWYAAHRRSTLRDLVVCM